jgi:hypothetical protein
VDRAEENYLLIQRLDADRKFLVQAYLSNPHLLAQLDDNRREWFSIPIDTAVGETAADEH